MLTIEKIKEDLKDIQYYYSEQKVFDGAANIVGQSSVMETVNRYNKVVCSASIRLYHLYLSMYVENNTQEAIAEDWNCSAMTVRRLNRELIEHLLKVFNEQD